MKSRIRLLTLPMMLVGLAVFAPGHSQIAAQTTTPAKGRGWTLDEAMQQLRLYPQDPYLQYVAMQLARREKREGEIAQQIDQLIGRGEMFGGGNERVGQVDLFSLFSGSLAVQESLQLDTMRGQRRTRPRSVDAPQPVPTKPAPGAPEHEKKADELPRPVDKAAEPTPVEVKPQTPAAEPAQEAPPTKGGKGRVRKALKSLVGKALAVPPKSDTVAVSSLTGPTIKSHPWKEMLGGKKPDVGVMAKYVPEDFYLVEFRSLVKLLEVMDQSDLWSTHVFNQSVQEARTQLVGERLKKQLAVESNNLLRPIYDAVVEEVAVVGSDLYLREGSDVTLIFRAKQPEVLKARMEGFLANAEKAGAKRDAGNYLGVAFTHLETPDRTVHVYSAYPTPDVHVRSNSRIALERIIEAIQGKNAEGKAIHRLGDTDEYAYVRTLMPRGAAEEDGLVYLSDPFIRRLVGPQLKLTELRRMICYNHLKMIGHAALMYRTEFGKSPESLEQLAKSKCAPGVFGQGEFKCPEGGTYTLSADGLTGVCSHHGHSHSLTPCCEIPVKEVSRDEADEYRDFLENYNQYWRTFFDPIALRIQSTPKRYRIETIVLPLIDNSIYTNMARAFGGKPEPLDILPVPKRNIFSMAVRLNKHDLLREAGMEELLAEDKDQAPQEKERPDPTTQKVANDLRQVGLAMHNYLAAYNRFPGVAGDPQRDKGKLSWRVHLLPYLEQERLYQEFKLDEPWDSEHNKKLIAKIPDVYRPSNAKLATEGKTRIVVPVGPEMIFQADSPGRRIADITDGTSNTFLLMEADDGHSVVWTKPDDLAVDLKNPLAGLATRPPGAFVALLADGSTSFIRKSADPKTVAAMFTRAGGETAFLQPQEVVEDRFGLQPGGRSGFIPDFVQRLKLGELIAKGIGNQIGFHMYDAEPTFDFSLPQFLGMSMGSFNGRGLLGMGGGESMIGVLVTALNAPVYISVPVKDAKIVDDFLARLDGFLAVVAREKDRINRFIRIEQDYYQLPNGKGKDIRAYGFRFGPLKWRFFWGRIGDGLYIASKPFILDDLLAMHAAKAPQAVSKGPSAHGMIRLRPHNWDRVLADYRLGWAENNREACLHNLGPMTSLSRAVSGLAGNDLDKELEKLSGRLYGVRFFCPEEGRYVPSPDGGSMQCSVHGSVHAPKQPLAPSEKSSLGKLLREFDDMTLSLTFLEDGLRAVVTIDRK